MSELEKEFKELILELLEIPEPAREVAVISRLEHISPDPEFLDYVFQSNEFVNDDGSTNIEALTNKVFSYKPICL